jgi:excisionase family DNA binding protein
MDAKLITIEELWVKLDRIERTLADLLEIRRSSKEWYSVAEVAELVGVTAYTTREWCRHGRIRAQKRATGRGRSKDWMISHAELTRYRNEGLLPLSINRPV